MPRLVPGVVLRLSRSGDGGNRTLDRAEDLRDPMTLCPRFSSCSVPSCPLDINQDSRTTLKGEPKCLLPKARRREIGKAAGLPRQGLTKREWAARLRFDSLSESERRRMSANLRPFSRVIHGSQSEADKSTSKQAEIHKPHRTVDNLAKRVHSRKCEQRLSEVSGSRPISRIRR